MSVADLQMPAVGGLELQETMIRAGHVLPVIFVSGHGDIPTTVRAMRQGAERDRLRALRLRPDLLTPREREVLRHVVRGG